MHKPVSKAQVKQYIGKQIAAYKKDGSVVTGKLVRMSGNRLILEANAGKKVKTKAVIPLVLFDLLAIGTAPYAYGPFGGGYGSYGGYSAPGAGYGGYGYPPGGFFW
ncbi:hypothetical protein [Paenibacillus sp. DMB20]|uniref:hypothetical protein n=1 Tax=Paenibacillus sp. DMB20 TaxID=1642570 RepID=UPI000627D1EE|nr:hypothetical protein [Paenibacillus sp. DMB20]KKO52958.1 hypothetical protein XI25_17365 [Paenibacillus sp. DMB20]KKO53561.1 hypothetical protein XI25_11110 [Paenibacillus sp. DMB20]